jgi:UDP-glucose:glycoprotein glucosyltransferase
MNLAPPSSWLVTPIITKYDLDNIKLETLESDRILYAQFQLQHLILEGHCAEEFDYRGPAPPRGLQLVLGTNDKPILQDTLVMSNYGYFQLKANPGVWNLKIKPNSRSSQLYDIKRGNELVENDVIIISDFSGRVHSLLTKKKADKQHENLLAEGADQQGEDANVWDSISGLWNSDKSSGKNETIHVFSLASGHLYERFLKIMMLSVMKQTQSPVKFWLLANFLSPQFKDSIPALAAAYNFEYELVTYKWPAWLFKQTEKQRIIWA